MDNAANLNLNSLAVQRRENSFNAGMEEGEDVHEVIKLLLVDDEIGILNEMNEYLSLKGFACETAQNAEEALSKLKAINEIGVVLTDIRMPGMDGLTLVKKIREEISAERPIEIIVLTGHAGREEAINALQAGAMDFMIKPVILQQLGNTCDRAVDSVRWHFDEKKYKKNLEQALETEITLNKIQREFIALVSHEFRTPLSIIDGSAQRLVRRKDECDPDEIIERASRIRNAVSRLISLIESILSASRLDSGKVKFDPSSIDLAEIIKAVCRRQGEISEEQEIITELSELPDKCWGDANLLDQIFTNLVSNAVKYSPNHDPVTLKGWAEDGFVRVSIQDQGVGIPESEMPRLFDRYFRASTATGIPGTGIGLNLIKSLVEMHDGTIDVESVESEGSTFTVRLPINAKVIGTE